jgi:hypothetical protein
MSIIIKRVFVAERGRAFTPVLYFFSSSNPYLVAPRSPSSVPLVSLVEQRVPRMASRSERTTQKG